MSADIKHIDVCENSLERANALDAKAKEVEASVRIFEDSRSVSLEVFHIELGVRAPSTVSDNLAKFKEKALV